MRRDLFAVLAAALVGLFVFPVTALAGATKVDVCHSEGNGSYHLINISENAFQKHVDHGDGSPGDPVFGMGGYVFGDDCSPVLAVVDTDGDGVLDDADNCPTVANPDQSDRYGSDKGDACEDDSNGDGVLDVNEPHICVSVDGMEVIRNGLADCVSDLGSPSNIAVAHGDMARAVAIRGNNNTATATGTSAVALARNGDNNTATATGTSARASANTGDNTATATGDRANATAVLGTNNTATATGEDAIATASNGNNNTATATGDRAEAGAFAVTGCTALAIGDDAFVICS